ncbi:MAG: acyl-CoA dehydrogenase, partial [Roseiarcus sp.]
RLFALALGGACLAKAGLAAQSAPRQTGGTPPLGRVALARFFAEKLATAAPGLAQTVLSGGAALKSHEAALQEFA